MTNSEQEPEVQTGSRAPGMPAWLKISVAVVAVLVIVVVVVLLMGGGGGEHGPGRHGAEGAMTPGAVTSAGALG